MFVSFSTGLMQCSAAVFGAACASYATTRRSLAMSIVVAILVPVVYIWQAYRLFIFFRYQDDACWQPAEPPGAKDEIDDPAFALITNLTMGLVRPTSRELGGFEPPDEDAEEPGRTERHLARVFSLRLWTNARRMLPGDALSELPTWLGDSSGSARGMWYLFMSMLLQLILAAVLGVTFSLTWSQTSEGSKALLGVLIAFQLLTAWWSVFRTANDKIDGFQNCMVSLTEATSTCLLLASAMLATKEEGEEEVDIGRLTRALELSVVSTDLLMVAIFVPIGITVCTPRSAEGCTH